MSVLKRICFGDCCSDAPSGGDSLPTNITNPQNGQLLQYQNGVWVNVDAPSGGVLVANVVYEPDKEQYRLDKTLAEISNADMVVIKWEQENSTSYNYLVAVSEDAVLFQDIHETIFVTALADSPSDYPTWSAK